MPKYTMPFTEPANLVIERICNKYGIHTISRLETGGNVTLANIIRYAQAMGYEVTLRKMDNPLEKKDD